MRNNIAIELLKTLTKDELKKFESFINSSYFNTNKPVIKLFEVIKKSAPEYVDKSLQRENLFKKLYPNKEYNELSLRTRMSELTELIRKYFAISHLEKNDFAMKFNIVEELTNRGRHKLSEKYINDMLAVNADAKDTGVPAYYERVQLVRALLYINRDDTTQNNHPENLIQLGDALINYFYGYLFKIVNNMYFNEDVYNYKPDFNIIKIFLDNFNNAGFLEKLEKSNYANYPHLAIYYYMYMTRIDKYNDKYFYKLKELVMIHHEKFDRIGKTNLWGFLINAVSVGLQFIDTKYVRELFEIHKFFLSLKIMPLNPGEYFLQLLFDSVFTISLLSGEYEFAEEFLNEYEKDLNPENKENYMLLCRAILAFHKKDFNGSLNYLSKLEMKEIFIKTRSRFLYFMNYYETNSFESALSLIDSLKHFLAENNRMTDYLQEGLHHTIKYATKILNAKMNNKKLDYAIYKEALELKEVFSNRNWMLDKMKELI